MLFRFLATVAKGIHPMSTTSGAVSPALETNISPRDPKKAAMSEWIGGALEYYDFALYGLAATLIFPAIFFPSENPTVAIIASLATYAVGYVSRPLGAVVLGAYGDRHGRKHVLVFAMLLMGFATFAVGLLPTYGQVGVLAPVLLVVLRLIQGFAVAGELGGASAMIVEHSPDARRGFFSSFSLQGTQVGSILATAVLLPLAAILPRDQLETWGWRIPFLLSAVVILAGYLIRRRAQEPPAYLAQSETGKASSGSRSWRSCAPDRGSCSAVSS
jgi:MFS family permease